MLKKDKPFLATTHPFVLMLAMTCLPALVSGQNEFYFPPNGNDEWETISPENLGWCEDELQNLRAFLAENQTRAFLILKDGKIVEETYFDDFDQDRRWYWASAAKGLTAFSIGLLQEQEQLSIHESTQTYLGRGWSKATYEDSITLRHQLTMTSGLDDSNFDCTLDTCLVSLTTPGDRWAYHNGPYTLLTDVIEEVTQKSITDFVNEVFEPAGIEGNFLMVSYNRVFFSTPRVMARFGLLMLNEGVWKETTIMNDTAYFHRMIRPSQDLNPAYGYLWWLNGQEAFILPQSQNRLNGKLVPNAPDDMYAAFGLGGQILNVVPKQGLVMVRMGDNPQGGLPSIAFNNQIWERFQKVQDCGTTGHMEKAHQEWTLYPNPAKDFFTIDGPSEKEVVVKIYDLQGKRIRQELHYQLGTPISTASFKKGVYLIQMEAEGSSQYFKLLLHH